MRKHYVIKLFKLRANSNDVVNRIIVVMWNTSRPNSGYLDKIGVLSKQGTFNIYCINLRRLGFWLNKGAVMKSKVSWIVGILGNYEKIKMK